MKKFLFYWLPVIAYAALIFSLSSRSEFPQPVVIPFIDKVAHFIEYALFSFLILRALKNTTSLSAAKIRMLAVLIAIFYGFTDELHQSYVPYRSMDSLDLIFDSLGAICGRFFIRG